MKFAVAAYGQGGWHFHDVLAISPVLADELTRGAATILVKGSRFMGMERVVQPLLDVTKQKPAV